MSWLPPFSRGGAVRAASAAARSKSAPVRVPRMASWGNGGSARGGTRSGLVAISAASRAFHFWRSSADGAVPMRPGWTLPMNETWGMWRDVAIPPRKSHMTLYASGNCSVRKPPPFCVAKTPVVTPSLPGQRTGVFLGNRADVEKVHDQQVSGFRPFYPDRPAEHVHGAERSVEDVLGRVVVDDGPVEPLPTFDTEDVTRPHGDVGRDVRVPPVVSDVLLVGELLRRVERKHYLWHLESSLWIGGTLN